MAHPRVFVSSTYYDLKHLRSSLDNFIESFGYEPVLSEKGDIAYSPDMPLDESCYREVENADVFVIIVGGRCGSEGSGDNRKPTHEFFERYDSITKREYEAAVRHDIPTYVLVESSVYTGYQTYLRNKGNKETQYAHVDSVNIFHLIENVLSKPRNNPVHTFERFSDIESWLREQWSGLFRELLHRMSGQQQIATLASQVEALRENNTTLKRYLEALMKKISPDESPELIESEKRRLELVEQTDLLKRNDWIAYILSELLVPFTVVVSATKDATSIAHFGELISQNGKHEPAAKSVVHTLTHSVDAQHDCNEARKILGVPPLDFPEVVPR